MNRPYLRPAARQRPTPPGTIRNSLYVFAAVVTAFVTVTEFVVRMGV